jgi:transcriptional regulator with XRE-family HTH domain
VTVSAPQDTWPPTLRWPEPASSPTTEEPRPLAAVLTIGLFAATLAGLSSTTTIPVAQAEICYLAPGSVTGAVVDGPLWLDGALIAARTRARLSSQTDTWDRDLPATVTWLHAESGLTWEQLGRALGVSRRAVHLWARGGRMNSINAENLNALVGIVRELAGSSPDANRAALLAARPAGRSLFDEFRQRVHDARTDVTGTPWRPDQLIGALHDEVTQER